MHVRRIQVSFLIALLALTGCNARTAQAETWAPTIQGLPRRARGACRQRDPRQGHAGIDRARTGVSIDGQSETPFNESHVDD